LSLSPTAHKQTKPRDNNKPGIGRRLNPNQLQSVLRQRARLVEAKHLYVAARVDAAAEKLAVSGER
jgi:hypothetical protein